MKNKIKLLDKYILESILAATVVGIIVFVVIWISPEIMFKIIGKIIDGEISFQVGLKLFVLEIPSILGKAIPVGLLLGSLFVVDVMSRNFELVILRSAGVGFFRLVTPVITLGLIFAVFCLFAYNVLIPYSAKKLVYTGKGKQYVQFAYLERDIQSNPKQLIIVNSYDGTNIQYINIFQIAPDNLLPTDDPSMKNIMFAQRGEFTGDEFVVHEVKVYELLTSGIYKAIVDKPSVTILKGKSAINAQKLLKAYDIRVESLTHKEVNDYLNLLKDEQISDEYNYTKNKLYQRYAQAVSCIVFALCGVVLGWSRPRENRFVGFTLGALIIFSYYLTIPFIDMLAEKSILPPFITAFLPITIISVGTYFYAKLKDI
ncbi:MAG: LptF/LptG family permease [Candidatus Gastranaerophilales bacterium]|nr:LptF/LptG family permease [Candidatus Gastranaerophilales bacterium]